ncbi:uncharacterized protein LAESUDRAFT_816892, partial [Laetiporus sulphureus 93-53]
MRLTVRLVTISARVDCRSQPGSPLRGALCVFELEARGRAVRTRGKLVLEKAGSSARMNDSSAEDERCAKAGRLTKDELLAMRAQDRASALPRASHQALPTYPVCSRVRDGLIVNCLSDYVVPLYTPTFKCFRLRCRLRPTNAVPSQVPRPTFLPPTPQLGEPRSVPTYPPVLPQVRSVAQPPAIAGPSNPAQGQGRHDIVGQVVWEGSLAWTGTGNRTGSAQVLLLAGNCVDQLRAMQWPSVFMLKPSQHPALPQQTLQDWIKRNAGQRAIVHVIPQPRLADTKTNEESFAALARLLSDQSRYAVAAFSGPNGENRDRILLFPGKPGQFVSVVFLGQEGMPELPHEVCGMPLSKIPPQFALLLYKLPQARQAMLMELPQEKR